MEEIIVLDKEGTRYLWEKMKTYVSQKIGGGYEQRIH